MEGNKENFYGEKIVSFAANDQGIKEFEGNKIEVLLMCICQEGVILSFAFWVIGMVVMLVWCRCVFIVGGYLLK